MQKIPQIPADFNFPKIFYLSNLIDHISPEAAGIINPKNLHVVPHMPPFDTYLFQPKFQAALISYILSQKLFITEAKEARKLLVSSRNL
jgi:hypothetical protein